MSANKSGNQVQYKVLLHSAYSQRLAGAARSTLEIARCLDRSRFKPVFMFTEDGPVPRTVRTEIETVIFDTPPELNAYNKFWLRRGILDMLKLFLLVIGPYSIRLAREFDNLGIDLVHCRDERSLLLVAWAARLKRKPVVCHVRGDIPPIWWLRLLTGLLPDRIITVNRTIVDQLPRPLRRKCTVINNSISEQSIEHADASASASLRAPRVETVVSTFVSVVPGKGLDTLLDALSTVRNDSPELRIHCRIVGDDRVRPDYSDQLRRRAEECNLQVDLTGWVDPCWAMYHHTDIVVLPSLSEGLPRTLLEAMWFGKPVVATSVGGVPDLVVNGETGVLVPPGDAPALAAAITKLCRDPQLRQRFGAAGAIRVRSEFSSSRMIAGVQAQYLDLLKDTPQ